MTKLQQLLDGKTLDNIYLHKDAVWWGDWPLIEKNTEGKWELFRFQDSEPSLPLHVITRLWPWLRLTITQ